MQTRQKLPLRGMVSLKQSTHWPLSTVLCAVNLLHAVTTLRFCGVPHELPEPHHLSFPRNSFLGWAVNCPTLSQCGIAGHQTSLHLQVTVPLC